MSAAAFLQGLTAFLIVAFGQPSFVPYLGPVAAALGYALFWRAISIFPFKMQKFWRGSLWYAAISIVQLSWMTSIEYQGIYILFVWLGLSLGVGLQFGLLSALIPYNRPLTVPRILGMAAVWTLFEWSRYHFICGYSWNLSGLALSNSVAIQFASVFGILGLSFWVILSNLMGLRALMRKGIIHYAVWIGVAAVPYCFGLCHLNYHDKKMAASDRSLNCVLVQTGILPPEKIPIQGKIRSFISPYEQWKSILHHIGQYRDRTLDLIVLPEAAVPFSLNIELYDPAKVKEIFTEVLGKVNPTIFPRIEEGKKVSNAYWVRVLASAFDSDVVIGLDYTEKSGNSYNSAFFVRPFSLEVERYDKQVLMPLAEYLPYPWLAPLVKAYGITDFFTPGSGALLFEGSVPMSVSICCEETFPAKVREGRLLGAQLLVNVTNDGWYPFSRLPSQHFEHARFRSVENGVPLVRACNTGVTAAVDSLGRTIGKLEEKSVKGKMQKGALFAEISPYDYSTLFAIWGNSGILCICLALASLFFILKKGFRW